ncbi:MAG: hypothetical protein H8E66_34755 [Planctomycetes bacterium]|nr:hypothetical protein [Planctomycetota bacterium]MBL7038963.1 hypothetical protein [Pirellulaceae bacterium]
MCNSTTYSVWLCLSALLSSHLVVLLSDCRANPPEPFVPQAELATTHLPEPLDEAGFVDYLEAVNIRGSKGVDPENNWEVVIRRAFGPLKWDKASDAEYYRRLGIPPVPVTPPEGSYFQPLKLQFWGIEDPWRAEDYPELAQWLLSQSALRGRLVAGSPVVLLVFV